MKTVIGIAALVFGVALGMAAGAFAGWAIGLVGAEAAVFAALFGVMGLFSAANVIAG